MTSIERIVPTWGGGFPCHENHRMCSLTNCVCVVLVTVFQFLR